MSSVHGHRGLTVSTRSSPARRGRTAAHTSQIPVGGIARIRPVTRAQNAPSATRSTQNASSATRSAHHAVPATRQTHRAHSATTASGTARRNTVPSIVAHVVPSQNSVVLVEEVVDLTCNSPHRPARQAQLPVVLGGGANTRVPVNQPKPVAKPNMRKRSTAPAAAVDVSPSKKYRNLQDVMCPVCFDDMSLTNPVTEKPVFSTNCGHLFCKPCILACLERNNSCPICRKCQKLTDIHPIYINEKF